MHTHSLRVRNRGDKIPNHDPIKRREYAKKYRLLNKAKIKNQRLLDKTKIKKRNKNYYLLHKAEHNAKSKQYRLLHKLELRDWRKIHFQIPKIKEHAREYLKNYRKLNKAQLNENRKNYLKTHPIIRQKMKAKKDSRRQGKGFVPLAPNFWDCPVDYHHISPTHPFVVPIPREIHRGLYGKMHFVVIAGLLPSLFGFERGDDNQTQM